MVVRGRAVRRWSWTGLAVLGLLGLAAACGRMRGETPKPPAVEPAPEVISLTRVSYKVKSATAEAIAAVLKDNVKSVVLETKTEGDTFTVTTTPEAQYAVGQFIALIQGKPLSYVPGPPVGGTFFPNPGGTGGPSFPGPGGTGGPFFPGPGGTGPRPGGTGPGPGGTGRPTPPPGATTGPPGG